VVQGLLAGDGHPKNTVLVKGDRSLKQREVQRVIDAIAQAREQVESLEIFHLGVMESK
jgi:5-enolpyruvylshikimate-3-phosphate synthase